MADFLNPIAEVGRVDSGDIRTPEEAAPLKGTHSFFCPDFDCKDKNRKLILKRSVKDKYFFSHLPGCEHEIRPETLLHKLAIKWFENKTEFEIPEGINSGKRIKKQFLNLDPQKTYLEYSRLKTIIPDVKLYTFGKFEFAVEIFVTNDISDSKKKLIEQFGLPTIRIDLSDFYKLHPQECRINKDFVSQNLDNLLTDINLKEWVVFPNMELLLNELETENIPQPQHSNNPGCMVILPFIGILWLVS